MALIEKLKQKSPTLSFEFFPPKNPEGWATLYATLGEAGGLGLDYVSVTYGAGGSTRQKTVDLVSRIQSELGIESIAHLTCVGHSRDEIRLILEQLQQAGIRNVLALRGDPPKGDTTFKPHPDGFAYATDLIEYIAAGFDFSIGCACYPEKHQEAISLEKDIEFLKRKQDNGANFAITQLFFDNEDFYRFRDSAVKAGVTMPIIAGIMPVSNVKQLGRFQQMCGCTIPDKLRDFLQDGEDGSVLDRGVEYAVGQSSDLLKNDVGGIHLYTLNKSSASKRITEELQRQGFFQDRVQAQSGAALKR